MNAARTAKPTDNSDTAFLALVADFDRAAKDVRRMERHPRASTDWVQRACAAWDAAVQALLSGPRPVTSVGKAAFARVALQTGALHAYNQEATPDFPLDPNLVLMFAALEAVST